MTDEIIVGVVVGIISSILTWFASIAYNKFKLRKDGLRVYMIRNDRSIESRLVPFDSKIFSWKGGQYMIKEECVYNSIIGEKKDGIHKNRLDKREIFFREGEPQPLFQHTKKEKTV